MPSPISKSSIPLSYLDTDTALTANSDVKVPSQKAVKAYVPVKATGAEINTGTDDAKFATPKAIADSNLAFVADIPVKATGAEVTTGTDDDKFVTAKALADAGIVAGGGMDITAEPASDHTASGVKITLTAGADLAFGDVGYIKSDGKVGLIDADAIATMSAVVMCCDATISNNATGNFLLFGVARDDTWNWTVGGLIYGTVTGTTGNTLSQTQPTGVDDVIQILGVATHADRMIFNPQLVQIERTA